MFTNYLKIALRNLRKYKAYAFINIFGLAIGMAATILMLLFVQNELSYDKYHEKSDRIYRASREWVDDKGVTALHLGHLAPPFSPLLKNDFEGIIEESGRITEARGTLVEANDKKFEEEDFFFGENQIFSIFSWEFVAGDPAQALNSPNGIVITESAAQRYFDRTDVMGEEMIFNNYGMSFPFKVTGVVKDIPGNSHFSWEFMASFRAVEEAFGREQMMQNWGSNNYSTYILMEEGKDISVLESGIPDFFDRHLGTSNDGEPASTYNRLHFWPLTDVHLYSHLDSEIEANGDIAYVYLYGIIAMFTLIIACINFMNLSTAQSSQRSREVGMRKVMGAMKGGLVRQFLTESVVFALLGLIFSFVIIFLVLPYFNEFFQRQITIDFTQNSFLWLLLFGIVLFAGILAGLYPAFYLTKFQPASILKGGGQSPSVKLSIRSALVVFQFFISIVLIIGVGMVRDQLDYVRSKNLGFDKDHIIVLPSTDEIYERFGDVQQQFLQQPGINSVSLSSRVPSGRLLDSQGGEVEMDGEMKVLDVRVADIHVDFDYMKTYKVPFAAGRDFDPLLASDSSESFILNEAAVAAIGWNSPQESIGKQFNYGGRKGQVIGVVKDFHFESLHQSIAPIVFVITQGRANLVSIKYDPDQKDEVVAYLKEQWSYFRPGFPFDYREISSQFNSQYENEERLANLVTSFSVLAVLIAAMGLFGLATFVAERRTKELGIRKVMGASIWQLLILLGRNFTFLVIIALIIAIPVAYFGLDMWLDSFAYRMTIGIWPFVVGGVLALIISWITISYQTVRAARTNPVDSLRSE
ncbi:ABC transporter permease [Fulvivirga sedimenti]|uniref:ABC transporter permease n=1 Tax=Fulvivirga sedimenti TaxID=2879465 RepID=A0A9X1KXM7_9BACT|nr:ABC transporter permease [Fulvivirga sedimenti]MCA6074342.1 ABC transporter permease [Fulvivirga sedimenti]